MTIVLESRVAAAGDDVEERASGGISNNVSDLELGLNGSDAQKVGLRFTGLDIPQGAIITAAYIQFTVDEVSSGASSLLIRGDDSDSAAPLTDARFNVSSRPMTDASASWSPAAWTARGESGADQRTSDLSAIVQEIVDRPGWAPSGDIAFIVTGTGTRTAKSFEADAGVAPLLRLQYLLPGDGSAPVAFATPPDSDGEADRIAELAAAGTAVGITAAAVDPDAGDTVSYSVDDARFAIDSATGAITRSGIGTLDFETEPDITLRVTATSTDGSSATQDYALVVLDENEPVAFGTPADVDSAANAIAENAADGSPVRITVQASDPDAGDMVTYGVDDDRFDIGSNGVITRSGTGTLNAVAEPTITINVAATSSDGSSEIRSFDIAVTEGPSGGGVPTGLSYVRTIQTSQWSPPSPDPSGIVYIDHLGTLLVSDGEVNEMSIFTGNNVFETTISGSLVRTYSTLQFSDEPVGLTYNPTNQHIFFADDTGTRAFYELDPGDDGVYMTSDDVVTTIRTRPFGFADVEGLAYDPVRDVLHVATGVDNMIFTIDPGPNGIFDGAPSDGGDDVATSFAAEPLGIDDPEGIAYDPIHDVLFVTASRSEVAMLTPEGEFVAMFELSGANSRKPAGLAMAPSSIDPNQMSLFVVDRGVDNDSDPTENDGKIYEFLIQDDWPIA